MDLGSREMRVVDHGGLVRTQVALQVIWNHPLRIRQPPVLQRGWETSKDDALAESTHQIDFGVLTTRQQKATFPMVG